MYSKKKIEFYSLEQKDKTIVEYRVRLLTFERFTLIALAQRERDRAKKFVAGLRLRI